MNYRQVLLIAVASALLPSTGFAQTGQTAQIPLQFDFLNPGARSLGLGSAFIAVADDATAAYTNPAGLTQLGRREVSLELRFRHLSTPYLAGGRLRGTVTNTGIDTLAGPRYADSEDNALRPYFVSGALPYKRWTVAVHRHELVLQQNEFLSEGAFRELGGANSIRQLGLAGERSLDIVNYGAGVAYRLSDAISLGVGVSAYQFSLDSSFGTLAFTDGNFSPVDVSSRGNGSTVTQTSDSTKFAFSGGVLISLNRKVRVGAVYRQGVEYEYEQIDSVPNLPVATNIGAFRTPSTLGVGLRVAPRENFAIAADYQRVQYSRLSQDFITLQVPEDARGRVAIHDGNEFHVGAEYTWVRPRFAPTFRVGTWLDPSHAVQYAKSGKLEDGDTDLLLSNYFPGGEDLWHFTFGVGVPLSRSFEFNAGFDLTGPRTYVSMSVVARFGK